MPLDQDIVKRIKSNDPTLTSLDFEHKDIQSAETKELCDALLGNRYITKINFSNSIARLYPPDKYPPVVIKRTFKKDLVLPNPRQIENNLNFFYLWFSANGFNNGSLDLYGNNFDLVRMMLLTADALNEYLKKEQKQPLKYESTFSTDFYESKLSLEQKQKKEQMKDKAYLKHFYELMVSDAQINKLLQNIVNLPEKPVKTIPFGNNFIDVPLLISVLPKTYVIELDLEGLNISEKDLATIKQIIEKNKIKHKSTSSEFKLPEMATEQKISPLGSKGISQPALVRAEEIPLLREKALKGDVTLQVTLGTCYYHGWVVKQNYNEAVRWYRTSLVQDHPIATYYIGLCYFSGLGVTKDTKQGEQFLAKALPGIRKLASQGNADAQDIMGMYYERGFGGIPEDFKEAAQWYRKGAEQGWHLAQYHLSVTSFRIASFGSGKRDLQAEKEAFSWCEKAALQNLPEAQYYLAICYRGSRGVEVDFSLRHRLAFEWDMKAAEQGLACAQTSVARCFDKGIDGYGNSKDPKLAVKWYQLAAENNDPQAQYWLAQAFEQGSSGMTKNFETAYKWYQRAAEQENGPAAYWMACYIESGKDATISETERMARAIEWYQKASRYYDDSGAHAKARGRLATIEAERKHKEEEQARQKEISDLKKRAELGEVNAQFKLASYYESGVQLPQDQKQAFDLYQKAALQGHVEAQQKLGAYFAAGLHGTKDYAQAYLWYQKAADQGNDAACAGLKSLKEKGYSPPPSMEFIATRTTDKSEAKEATKDHIASAVSFEINYDQLTFGKELGRGGFGVVYQGTWRFNNVAIKQLLTKSLSADALEEFNAESRIMAQLRSDYVVQFRGICVSPTYCLVMEYMPKGSLFNLLRSSEPLDWPLRYRMATEIASGLAFLHASNIFHRDLKSLNVLLDEHYRTKLCDFGLSKVKKENQSTSSMGGPVGTLAWMAPELFERRATFTAKADIYSLAMILWEIASRKTPFADASSPSLIPVWVVQGQREEIPSNTPLKISSLIRFCWHADPNKRPTAAEVVTYLRSDQTEFKSIEATPSALTSTSIQGNLASGTSGDLGSSTIHPNLMSVAMG